MNAHVILIVGTKGTGKTTKAKEIVSKVTDKPKFVYDINVEYSDSSILPDFQDFCEQMSEKDNSVILYEEATIFLSASHTNREVNKQLVRSRHQNNLFVFVFHSLRTVPRWIMDFADYLILFKTMDSAKNVARKFEHPLIDEAFEDIRVTSKSDIHYSRTLYLK